MHIKFVKIVGLNISRLLREMEKQGTKIISIRRVAYNEIELEISSRDYKKLIDLPVMSCYNISVIKKKPKYGLFNLILSRMGIIIGIIVASFFVVGFVSRIWTINITLEDGLTGVTNESVLELLSTKGVAVGLPFSGSTRDLEKELLKDIDASSMVIVERDGVNLNVFIKARQQKLELTESNIVAAYDGVVTEINLVSGILTTNIGEAVTKGQVLIASGKTGDYFSEAVGDIKAKARIRGEAVGALNTSSVKRTGNTKEVTYYEIFGKKIYFKETFDEAVSGYSYYEVEEESSFVFNGLILPVKKVVATIYELGETEQVVSNAALITSLKEQAYVDAKCALPEGAIEGKVTYDVFHEGELYKVICNIETIITISTRSE